MNHPTFHPGDHVTVWVPEGHKPHEPGVILAVGSIPAYGTSAERRYSLTDGRSYSQAQLRST